LYNPLGTLSTITLVAGGNTTVCLGLSSGLEGTTTLFASEFGVALGLLIDAFGAVWQAWSEIVATKPTMMPRKVRNSDRQESII
jgi:hypothetical protein